MLDLIITRISSTILSDVILHDDLADHSAVVFILSVPVTKPFLSTAISSRSYKNINSNNFANDVYWRISD
jgi:hypothetical protein